jgi:phosphotransferase system enzyme I (PtsI)
MIELRLYGRAASPGIAYGRVVVLDVEPDPTPSARLPMEEAQTLRQAVAAVLVEVKALAGGAKRHNLAFQIEMLADDELAGSAHLAIARGVDATTAWTAAMNAEIESYRNSGEEYFSSRAADLQIIHDRVLAHLPPPPPPSPERETPKTAIPPGAVVVAADLTLSRFLSINWAKGGAVVLTQGNPSGDVAWLARARRVPMVVGLGPLPLKLAGQEALVDANSGEVVLNPAPAARTQSIRRAKAQGKQIKDLAVWRNRDAQTVDGTRIALHLALADSAELAELDPGRYDGIGLFRTETLFYNPLRGALPDETTQYQVYRQVAEWADERPVTIRALDASADQPIPGIGQGGEVRAESNPSFGLRGLRWLLRHPEILRTQFRALARAAVYGEVRVVLPMVTIPGEFHAARKLLDSVMSSLARESITARRPALGMMVDVPAAALVIEQFAADFFCIGLNELTQYLTAAGRDNGSVADLADPLNPAVLRLIAEVAKHGRETGCEVILSGDLTGSSAEADTSALALLLHTGTRALSVPPSALTRVKQAIAAVDLRQHLRH